MRRFHGGSDTLDTISAAASVIASSENRVPQATPPQSVQWRSSVVLTCVEKKRWGGCWSIKCCFGFRRHKKRIGHAVLVPETSGPANDTSAPENPTQAPPPFTLPFIAPPSSPASFLQSEPPSTLQSPVGMVSSSMYSPMGPASIFAIGPYAHETQLVSPPVFSTFTTEPSTAPFTPPPESVHLTTPSSPEVPFAQLLDPNVRNSGTGLQFPFSNYEFQSYQLYPGSPVGQLISPSSGVSGSGTSSPFPDLDFAATGPRFPEFNIPEPRKLLNLDHKELENGQDPAKLASSNFPLDPKFSDVVLLSNSVDGKKNDQVSSHRVSFELKAEEASSCSELKPENAASLTTARSEPSEIEQTCGPCAVETSNHAPEEASTDREETPRHQKHRSLTLGSLKEFNFDSTTGGDTEKHHNNRQDWWANGIETGKEDGAPKNWSFPVMQPDMG